MAKDSLRQWDTTAANNTDLGAISLAENVMRPPAVNNAMREHMAQVAEHIDEMSYPTAGGSADALTLTPATASAAYTSNDVWTFKAVSSNTTAATLNISGLGAKAIRKISGGTDVALAAGDIAAGSRYTVVYDSAANAAAGAWIIAGSSVSLASTTDVLTGTDASKAVTSDALAALWEKGSDVASAGTVTLGEGGLFHITGTTTITDIDFSTPKNGRAATLIFDGALTLTHNATTLILPGGANITTAAGDRCDIVQDSGDNMIVTHYTRASGGWELIGTAAPSSAAAVTFTGLSAYRSLRVSGYFRPATDGQFLGMQFSTNGGVSFLLTSGDYWFQSIDGIDATASAQRLTTITAIPLTANTGNVANEGGYFQAEFSNFNQAKNAGGTIQNSNVTAAGVIITQSVGFIARGTTARDALRIIASSGNIAEGWIVLEGLRG